MYSALSSVQAARLAMHLLLTRFLVLYIPFTGSTPVGRNIAKLAAEGPMLKRLELELDGNGPFVVLSDADLGQVVEAAVFGKFLDQGQTCMSINRFTIDDRIHDELEGFADRVCQLEVGDPNAPDTMIGLIINESQLDGLQRWINEAISSGAHQIMGVKHKPHHYPFNALVIN
jgi:aldehyde dehydrogenase (NAD+)